MSIYCIYKQCDKSSQVFVIQNYIYAFDALKMIMIKTVQRFLFQYAFELNSPKRLNIILRYLQFLGVTCRHDFTDEQNFFKRQASAI